MTNFTATNHATPNYQPGQIVSMVSDIIANAAADAGTYNITFGIGTGNQTFLTVQSFNVALNETAPITVTNWWSIPANQAPGTYWWYVAINGKTMAQTGPQFQVAPAVTVPHMPLYGTFSAFPSLLKPAGPGDVLAGVGFLPDTGDTWVPIASATDEFTGASIDLTKWRTRLPGGYDHYNDELQRYADSGITVSNGTLKLTAHARPYDPAAPGHAPSPSGFNYPLFDSGCISSHTLLSYGYFEARMKFPTGVGVWPAFWLLPNKNYQGEIDIVEFVNNAGTEHPNMIHHNNLCDWPGSLVYWADVNENTQYGYWAAPSTMSPTYFTDDWHVVGCYWNELDNTTTIYIDGYPVVQRRIGPHGQLSAIIFNMAMGGGWPTTNGSGQAWTQPVSLTDQVFEVDYCRAFQKSGKILTSNV